MHNTDRTQLEYDQSEYETEAATRPCRCASAQESPLSEVEEMELAAELLEVNGEPELDQFLGKLVRRVGRRIKRFVRSPVGGFLVKALKRAATAAVPGLGPALAVAGAVGSALRKPRPGAPPPPQGTSEPAEPTAAPTPEDASEIFGLELEGLTPEDQEFEVARRFVRFGAEAVAQAAGAEEGEEPELAAEAAVQGAAQRHAPGLVRPGRYSRPSYPRHPQRQTSSTHGRWVRRGNRILLLDV
jgi:hypothetical protein